MCLLMSSRTLGVPACVNPMMYMLLAAWLISWHILHIYMHLHADKGWQLKGTVRPPSSGQFQFAIAEAHSPLYRHGRSLVPIASGHGE